MDSKERRQLSPYQLVMVLNAVMGSPSVQLSYYQLRKVWDAQTQPCAECKIMRNADLPHRDFSILIECIDDTFIAIRGTINTRIKCEPLYWLDNIKDRGLDKATYLAEVAHKLELDPLAIMAGGPQNLNEALRKVKEWERARRDLAPLLKEWKDGPYQEDSSSG
jgi:hypothetical protein